MAFSGCGTLDRAYHKQVTWTNAPVVQVVTNTVVATNLVAQVIERTNVVLMTNATTGGVSGYATREPVATNLVTVLLTNIVPVLQTNFIAVPVTNLVARPETEAAIQGVETARAVLETTPQGQAADAQLVKWLMTHQKEAGVFTTVSTLVDDFSDNPAAKLTAQEILERAQRAQL